MKKILISLSFVLLISPMLSAANTVMPIDGNGRGILAQMDGSKCVVVKGITVTNIEDGELLIDSIIAMSSTTTTAHAVVVDSDTTSGITNSYVSSRLVTPWIYTLVATTSYQSFFQVPLRTSYGLVVANSDADTQLMVCYRKHNSSW